MQPPTEHPKNTYITEFYNGDRSSRFMKVRLHGMNVYSLNSKCHQRICKAEYTDLVTIRMGIYVKSNNLIIYITKMLYNIYE